MKNVPFICLFLLMLLTGCANDNQMSSTMDTASSASYKAILNVNGEEYISSGIENVNSYTIDSEIGEVEKKISIEMYPFKSFESNYLEEGTKIFSVKEADNILLVEIDQGVYEIFQK